jgi:multidrug efflux pump subunit AcrA (membrane-fusion protein)
MMRVRTGLITLVASALVAGCAAPSATPPAPTAPAAAPTAASAFGAPAESATAEPAVTAAATVAEPARPTFTVQRGEIVNALALEARIAQVQQGVAFSEDGILKNVAVTIGSTVEQGQVLAELDLSDLSSQLDQARAVYDQDQRAVSQAVAKGRIGVDQARVDLEAARSELERARQPAKPDVILKARAAVQQAEADLQTVRNNTSETKNQAQREMDTALVRLQAVQEQYGQAKLEYDKKPGKTTKEAFEKAREELRVAEDAVAKARIAFDTARSNEVSQIQRAEGDLLAAKAELEKLLAGPDPFDIAQAEQAVKRAQIALTAAEQQATADPELVKQAARSQAEVERLEQQIASRRLISPLSGQVVAMEAVPGMAVRAAAPIIMIANAANRQLVAEGPTGADAVRATSRLMPGQQVSITFARYPDRTFTGTVASVPSRAPDTAATSEYTINYDAGDLALDIGDVAEVKAVLGRVENALWLPPEAVRVSRDRAFVILNKDGEEQRVEVTTGVITPERVEIVKGLMEGDKVYGEAAATR